MSGDVQVELWLHEYKLNALAAVLEKEGITVEQRMQDALTELYVARVPPEMRKEISTRIKEELAAREAEIKRRGNVQCSMCGRMAGRSISGWIKIRSYCCISRTTCGGICGRDRG